MFFAFSVAQCRPLSVRPSDENRRAFKIISTNKNGGRSHTFIIDPQQRGIVEGENSSGKQKQWNLDNLFQNIQSGVRSTFLPSGFPTKTPDGYLRYAVWSWIQDLSTQLRGVLATQRILEGVGVGREGATALSALLTFLTRDGCGMFASLAFTATTAPLFRADVKRWRLFADIILDVGITLECAAVHFPPAFFLPLISVGNMCKAMCGVAAGACSGPINLHWAKGSDISDISAKFGAQNTVTGSVGIVFAALFARSVSTLPIKPLWFLYCSLTALHILANRRCMRLIGFDYFNTLRMDMAISHFLKQYDFSEDEVSATLSPREAARREALLFTTVLPDRPTHPIHLGVSFNEFIDHTREHTRESPRLLLGMENDYWIAVSKRAKNPQILVALPENTSATSTAKAYFHARLLDDILVKNPSQSAEEGEVLASKLMQKSWEAFRTTCTKSGWNVGATELSTKGFEVAMQPL
eukprot:scaffold2558_cov172-Amphora_coffeaeformis.AAC.8